MIRSPFVRRAFVVMSLSMALGARAAVPAGESADAPQPLADFIPADARRVELPAGTFTVGPEPLVLPEGLHLSGQGRRTVVVAAPGTRFALRLGSDSRLEDMAFRAPESVDKHEHPAEGLVGASGRHIRFSGLDFRDMPRAGIVTANVRDLVIRDCRFENVATAINLQFTHDALVEGNTVINAAKHGIQFWGNWKWERMDCTNLKFVRNTVVNGGEGGIWGSGGRRIIMAENIVDGARDVGLDLEWCHDAAITGNVVRRAKNGGIALFFSCENVAITGNSIANDRPIPEKDAAAAWWVRSGIWLTYENTKTFPGDDGHKNVIIAGNTIVCAEGERRAIWIAGGQNIRVGDNAVRGGQVWHGGRHNEPLTNLKTVDMPATINPVDLPPIPVPPPPGIPDGNRFKNGDFARGMADWHWNPGKAQATAEVVAGAGPGGGAAVRLHNPTPHAPGVYAMLFQTVRGLTPDRRYRVSFRCKGEAAKGVWFGGGPGWKIRHAVPNGTYDWQRREASLITGPDADRFEFMVVSENIAEAFWIADLRFEEE